MGDRESVRDVTGGRIDWKGSPKNPEGARLALDVDGGGKDIVFKSVTRWPLYKDGAVISESFGLFSCGEETGVGVVEHLFIPRFGPLSVLPHVPKWTAMGLYSL